MRTIALLALWQVKNSVRTSLTQPRKLVPLLVLVIAVGSQMTGALLVTSTHAPAPPELAELITRYYSTIQSGIFLVLCFAALSVADYAFSGSLLTFPMADIDYLFPSPVSRRTILAYRLVSRKALSFFNAALLFYFLIWRPIEMVAPGRATPAGGAVALLALFTCLGSYANVALTIQLVLGHARLSVVRRWLMCAMAAAMVAIGYGAWRFGWGSLGEVGGSAVIVALFYPCRLAAESLAAPLTGNVGIEPAALLGVLYLATLTLVLSRRENYAESSLPGSERLARIRQAAREQNWAALFNIGSEGRTRGGSDQRPYAVPPFGSRAGALLWAHVTASLKRPFANVILPAGGGVAVSGAAAIWLPRETAAAVVGGASAYLLFILSMSGIATFRQTLQRQPLVRPLPFPDWQVVAIDVLPRVVIGALFGWGAGVTLLLTGLPRAELVGMVLLFCLPPLTACFSLIQYVLALWYPDAQDKLQQLLAGLIGLTLTGVVVSVTVPLLVIPILFKAPPWLAVLVFILPASAVCAGLLAVATWVYSRFQPV